MDPATSRASAATNKFMEHYEPGHAREQHKVPLKVLKFS